MEIIGIPLIAIITFGLVELIKVSFKNEKLNSFLPLIAGVIGIVLGIVAFYATPTLMATSNLLVAIFTGLCSGLSATGSNELVKHIIDFKHSLALNTEKVSESKEETKQEDKTE